MYWLSIRYLQRIFFLASLLRGFFCVLFFRYPPDYFCTKKIVAMNSQISDDIKLLFIQEELSQFGEELCDALSDALFKNKLIESGTLLDSLNYSSFQEGKNPGQRVSFYSYGRCVDMAGYKRNTLKVDTNRDVWGVKSRVNTKNRWYARNMYGGLNRLIGRVMYGLSDHEIARLKGILENRIANG